MAVGVKEITPKRLVAQWEHLPHKFNVNLWNFEVEAGKKAEEVFKKSFDLKRFNTRGGTAWPSRSPKNKHRHPLMVETGTLKNSIKTKHTGTVSAPTGITVYTDPNAFFTTKKHRGFCFAAVHNGPNKFRTKHMKSMPRRQFMGNSSVLSEELKKLTILIFKGFPK